MAVIINELEVVVENHQAVPEPSTPATQSALPVQPLDLFDVEERLQLYRLRVLAH